MKKIVTALLSLALVMVGGLFVACEPEHTHVFDVANKDGTNHWMECACGTIDETTVTAHTPASTDFTMSDGQHWFTCECGAVLGCEDHAAGTEYTTTADHHWLTCECGKVDETTIALHESEELLFDTENHWRECVDCGQVFEKEAHTGLDDTFCDVCGLQVIGTDVKAQDTKTLTYSYVDAADASKNATKDVTAYALNGVGTYHIYDVDVATSADEKIYVAFSGLESGLYSMQLNMWVNGETVDPDGASAKLSAQGHAWETYNGTAWTSTQMKNYGYYLPPKTGSENRFNGGVVSYYVPSGEDFVIRFVFTKSTVAMEYDIVFTLTKDADPEGTDIRSLETVAASTIPGKTDAVTTHEEFYTLDGAGTYFIRDLAEYKNGDVVLTSPTNANQAATTYDPAYAGIYLKNFAEGWYKVSMNYYQSNVAYSHYVSFKTLGTAIADGAWNGESVEYKWHSGQQISNIKVDGVADPNAHFVGTEMFVYLTGDTFAEIGAKGAKTVFVNDIILTITPYEGPAFVDISTLEDVTQKGSDYNNHTFKKISSEGTYFISKIADQSYDYEYKVPVVFELPVGEYKITLSYTLEMRLGYATVVQSLVLYGNQVIYNEDINEDVEFWADKDGNPADGNGGWGYYATLTTNYGTKPAQYTSVSVEGVEMNANLVITEAYPKLFANFFANNGCGACNVIMTIEKVA